MLHFLQLFHSNSCSIQAVSNVCVGIVWSDLAGRALLILRMEDLRGLDYEMLGRGSWVSVEIVFPWFVDYAKHCRFGVLFFVVEGTVLA